MAKGEDIVLGKENIDLSSMKSFKKECVPCQSC